MSATEQLPQSLIPVLAFARDKRNPKQGLWLRAMYVAKYNLEEPNIEDSEVDCDYNEDDDVYYIAEGWYELIENWGDYEMIVINDNYTITDWQPLPPEPQMRATQ